MSVDSNAINDFEYVEKAKKFAKKLWYFDFVFYDIFLWIYSNSFLLVNFIIQRS
jgi:hypothetical protein